MKNHTYFIENPTYIKIKNKSEIHHWVSLVKLLSIAIKNRITNNLIKEFRKIFTYEFINQELSMKSEDYLE
jgi:hypothetical protein